MKTTEGTESTETEARGGHSLPLLVRCLPIEEKDKLILSLAAAVQDVQCLINESHGVYGLYLNGDPSPWSELEMGGRHEEWLRSHEVAMTHLEALSEQYAANAPSAGDGRRPRCK